MFRARLFSCIAVSALSSFFYGQPSARAEEGAPADIIVVTSQFRRQSILEVPIAVAAFDNEDLTMLGVDGFDELSRFVPGLIVQEQSVNNAGFVIRGITSDSGASNIEPRVSLFQNGVSIARSRGSVVQLMDVERVEVLRGPQGTLFGRSAEIGAIHVITRKPGNDFEGSATAGFGNFDQQRYQGMLNVPVIDDRLALRLAAMYNRRDGYVENPLERSLNGTDSLSLRGSLRYTPNDVLTIDLIGNYAKDAPPGTAFKSGVIPAFNGDTDPHTFATIGSFGDFLGADGLGVDRSLYDVTAIFDWRFAEDWSLVSTTAYREFDSLEIFDPDGSAFDIFVFAEDATARQWSSDFRFSYDGGGRFRGFFGGGLFFEEGRQLTPLGLDIVSVSAFFASLGSATPPDENGQSFLSGMILMTPFPDILTPAFLTGDPMAINPFIELSGFPTDVFQTETVFNAANNSSFDLFAETSYDITDRLTLTLGGRYTRDRKETLFFTTVSDPNPLTPMITGMPGLIVAETGSVRSSNDQLGLKKSFGGFVWRGVLNYEIADGKFVYFNYSCGRRPEVIQDEFAQVATPAGNIVDGEFEIVPAEIVSSYELGAKGAFFDNRLLFDIAGYFYDYTNFQTGVNVAGPGEPPNFDILNGGLAEAIGLELALEAHPMEDFSLFFTYAYSRGRFDEVGPDGSAQEFGGHRFRLAPDHSFSAGLNYEVPSALGRFFITPTVTYQSKVFFEDENQGAFDIINQMTGEILASVPEYSQGAYALFNIRAGLRLPNDRVSIEAYVQNLFDKDYVIDGGNLGGSFGIPTFIPGPPRFYGGAVTVRF